MISSSFRTPLKVFVDDYLWDILLIISSITCKPRANSCCDPLRVRIWSVCIVHEFKAAYCDIHQHFRKEMKCILGAYESANFTKSANWCTELKNAVKRQCRVGARQNWAQTKKSQRDSCMGSGTKRNCEEMKGHRDLDYLLPCLINSHGYSYDLLVWLL